MQKSNKGRFVINDQLDDFETLFLARPLIKCLRTFLFRSFCIILLTCTLDGSRFRYCLPFGCLLFNFHTLYEFRLVDLYHVTLGYDATTSFTSLSWCNSRGVNSIHHCHYTMALADSKFDDFCLQCIQFE